MLHLLWVVIIGAVIGMIGGAIVGNGGKGFIVNAVCGILGSFVGESLFGNWGWQVADMAIIPSIIGAVIVVAVASFILNRMKA